MRLRWLPLVLTVLLVVFAGCSQANASGTPTTAPTATPTPAPTPTPTHELPTPSATPRLTPTPTATPTPVPTPTPTPTPKPDPEREAIVAFTRQALQIEGERNELVDLRNAYAYPITAYFFLNGHPNRPGYPGLPELQSAHRLKAQLSLLECPQTLQHVKESLIEAYRLEIDAAQLDRARDISNSFSHAQFYSFVNRSNVDSYIEAKNALLDFNGPWITAQKLRRDGYGRWLRVLLQHGIDPAQEGLAAWEKQGNNQQTPWSLLAEFQPLAAYRRQHRLLAGLTPMQQWQLDQFVPTYAAYQAQSYLHPGTATDWGDYMLRVDPSGAARKALEALREAAQLPGQEQVAFMQALGVDFMLLVHGGLRAVYGKEAGDRLVGRLGEYWAQYLAETLGEGESFLAYLSQRFRF